MANENGTQPKIVNFKIISNYLIVPFLIILRITCCMLFRFYEECLLREIVDPQYGKRLLKSDIIEPTHIKENIFKYNVKKKAVK